MEAIKFFVNDNVKRQLKIYYCTLTSIFYEKIRNPVIGSIRIPSPGNPVRIAIPKNEL